MLAPTFFFRKETNENDMKKILHFSLYLLIYLFILFIFGIPRPFFINK
jgi:hypothetical protein